MREGCVPWPEKLAGVYRERGYWTDELLGGLPEDAVAAGEARTALVTRDGSLTYAGLDAAADRMAAGLRARGLTAGDAVVVQLPNTAELVVVCLALFRTGVLPVFALPAHRAVEIEHLVRTSEAVAYICPDVTPGCDHREVARQVQARTEGLAHVLVSGDPGPYTALSEVDAAPEPAADRAPLDPEDVALFLLSGGTSGPPKLIPRTHADYTYQLRASARLCGVGAESRYLAALPVGHNFALGCPGVLGTLRQGGTVVLAPAPTPDVCFPLVEKAGVTVSSLVPPLVPLWLDAVEWSDSDLSSLRLLQVGGARLDPATAARVSPALGCTLQQVYGMAEGLLNFTRVDDPPEIVHHTQGRPLSPGDEIRVTREDGSPAADGEEGELLTRGPYTLRGYYRAPERNRTHFTDDGFFATGDLVTRDPAGNFAVVGRINDVINRGGEKVPAQEVEEHLLHDPRVQSAALIPLPDPHWGELTCACVQPRDAADPPELRSLQNMLREKGLAAYKLPDRLEILPQLPLTAVGKIDKKKLKSLLTPAEPPEERP
ncbi:(2,3-dihydroxybenzoyl)adenylate synthase [Streptomyces nanshensis]|uniref:Triostin synthetase I n=1 Tax=Streptomyces nanshensis TaxID=518642 RepID=A0A1E7KWT9_9ACTN|nr:AMP-binding protein [Streptomyces nanshensis]OEV08293.1 Triostin synthetase I [Streptomyces nanshensis]